MRVVLAEDSGIFREGLSLLLQQAGVVVCAGVSNVPTLHQAVEEHRPEVAVIDVRLPPTFTDEGIRAAVRLREFNPGLGILVLSTQVDPTWAMALLDAVPTGVGYLLKDRVADVGTLLDALRRVAAGGLALDSHVVQAILTGRAAREPLARLTSRERDVLALLAEGRSNLGISDELHLATKTVEAHIAAIFRAFGLETETTENRRVHAALTYLRIYPNPQEELLVPGGPGGQPILG